MDPNLGTAHLITIKVAFNRGSNMFVSNHGRFVVYAHGVNTIIYDTQQKSIRPVSDSIKNLYPSDITEDGEYLLFFYPGSSRYYIAHWINNEYNIIFDYLIDSLSTKMMINYQNNLFALFFASSNEPPGTPSSIVVQLFSIGNPVKIKWSFIETAPTFHVVGFPTLTFSEDGRYLIVSYFTNQSKNGFYSRIILFSVDSPKILASWNFTEDSAPMVDVMQVGQDLYIAVACESLYLFVYR